MRLIVFFAVMALFVYCFADLDDLRDRLGGSYGRHIPSGKSERDEWRDDRR